MVIRWCDALILGLVAFLAIPATAAETPLASEPASEPAATEPAETQPAPAEPIVVPLEKVSVFELSREFRELSLARGHMVTCTSQPADSITKLPPLVSPKPLYGEAEFDRGYMDPERGIRFAFVIDELHPIERKFQDCYRGLDLTVGPTDRNPCPFSFDPSGPPMEYGRLYFDLNQDGDLTNDPPLEIMKEPPEWARYKSANMKETIFDYLPVPLDLGSPSGRQPFVLMPVLNQWSQDQASLSFIATEARRGRLKIGKESCTVILSQPYIVSGRYDRPRTHMNLLLKDTPSYTRWWGSDQLCAVHLLDGRLREFSTTPTGDKLFVQPYTGDMGIIRIGAGPRKLDPLTMHGSIRSPTRAAAIGQVDPKTNWPEDTAEAAVPVGDYTLSIFYAQMGKLRLMVSDNYHADGTPRIRERKVVYGIKVRKDKPFILDFTNKPEVLFASPAREQVLHPGDEVQVKAVLIDPVLDIMIRNLYDTSRKEKKSIGFGEGTYEAEVSLDPTVVVTDAAGKRVAEGVMPFG